MFEQYLINNITGNTQKMVLNIARSSYNGIFLHLISGHDRQPNQVDVYSVISFIEDNNIVQTLDILHVYVSRKLSDGSTLGSTEHDLIKEIQLEICTCRALIGRIYELKIKLESYWFMGHFRTGPVCGLYHDLTKCLKMTDIKLNLLNILSHVH